MILRFILLCVLMLLPHILIGQSLHEWIYDRKETMTDILFHSLIWSILIEIPITAFFYRYLNETTVIFHLFLNLLFNFTVRCVIDYFNIIKEKIDYNTDQMLHICQILISALISLAIIYNYIWIWVGVIFKMIIKNKYKSKLNGHIVYINDLFVMKMQGVSNSLSYLIKENKFEYDTYHSYNYKFNNKKQNKYQ